MTDLSQLTELTSLWSGSPPHVLATRCLNLRHRARNCRICAEGCPVSAISIPQADSGDVAPVILNQDTCVRCGLCLNACPTGVFVQAEPPESKLPQAAASLPSQTIELACPRKEPLDLSQVPEASVVQTPRCLAALSVPTLLELAATGKTLWLNDSICHNCPIGEAHEAIEETIETANRWLQTTGHPPAIRSYLTAADELADEATTRPAVHGGRSVMSRRGFFRSLTRFSGQAAAGAVSRASGGMSLSTSTELHSLRQGSAEAGGHHLSHHIPAQRQQLAYALNRLSTDPSVHVPTPGLPIADVIITEACTACGLCAKFCPTQALSFVSDDEYYVLNFSAALCLGNDCRLCIIGCPADAVRFGQQVIVDELLSTQLRPVKAGRLAPCDQCGALTDARTEVDDTVEAPLCHVCRTRPSHPDLLASTANQSRRG